MNERRVLPRWKINQEVEMKLNDVIGMEGCCLEDMNLKGMCISLPRKLEQERGILKVRIQSKSDFNFNAEINLCWNQEGQGGIFYGMSFTQIIDRDRDKIYQFLSKNCSDQFKAKWWE